jgi:hypothetical protein
MVNLCCLRADVLFTVELTVPAIANISAIASVISNTSAIANTTAVTSGSDGSASEWAMGSGAESRVIIFILEVKCESVHVFFVSGSKSMNA